MSCDNDIVFDVSDISKCFEMYDRPAHRLMQMLCAGKRKFYKEFWALRDINFKIRRGEFVGVIGRNGAGKSTLLQILTGTLTPTGGIVHSRGRIAALLELGSGFNPDFTGRENVYMNASILGLSKKETDDKFDQIVDFADIGDFIDQPVKSYSSGMMVRLAFSVQAMVEPDILIVDEALAVGDAAFQRKCFARLEQMLKQGLTILLVTHDTETVKRMCSRVLYLKNSRCVFDGDAVKGVSMYLKDLFPKDETAEPEVEEKTAGDDDPLASGIQTDQYVLKQDIVGDDTSFGSGGGAIRNVRIHGLEAPNLLNTPGRIVIELFCVWDQAFVRRKIAEEALPPNLYVGYALSDKQNVRLCGANTLQHNLLIDPMKSSSARITFTLELPELMPGELFLVFALTLGNATQFVNLNWNDFAIQLNSTNGRPIGGWFNPPTHIDVAMNN